MSSMANLFVVWGSQRSRYSVEHGISPEPPTPTNGESWDVPVQPFSGGGWRGEIEGK